MSARKYLCYVSYLGNQYAKSITTGLKVDINHRLVAANVRRCLNKTFRKHIKSLSTVTVATKTEIGVHCPGNALTFEMVPKDEKTDSMIDDKSIVGGVNHHMTQKKFTIILSSCQEVPPEFDCRHHAVAREYIYRIAIPKPEADLSAGAEALFPISELYRATYLTKPERITFDLEKAATACGQLKGRHDYSSFCLDNDLNKVRTFDEFEVNKLDLSTHVEFDENYKNIDLFEFYLRGKSPLCLQIPKMISAVTAVATGQEPPTFISYLLEEPSCAKWKEEYFVMPSHGLYLIGVHYEDQDLEAGKTRIVEPMEEDDFDHDCCDPPEIVEQQLEKIEEKESS